MGCVLPMISLIPRFISPALYIDIRFLPLTENNHSITSVLIFLAATEHDHPFSPQVEQSQTSRGEKCLLSHTYTHADLLLQCGILFLV